MPTYDYECSACGHRFEAYQSIKADPLTECPGCKKATVHRVIGAGGGFIFKGSGFYITDYTRSKDYKEKAKTEATQAHGGAKTESSGGSGTGSGGASKDAGASSAPKPSTPPPSSAGSGGT
jgi:putative FmdB family regulatory protein